MPNYYYKCSDCGHELTELQGFDDKPLELCPKCGNLTLKRQITAPDIVWKGDGWTNPRGRSLFGDKT